MDAEPRLLAAAVRDDPRSGGALHGVDRCLEAVVDPSLQPRAGEAPEPLLSIETEPPDVFIERADPKSSARVAGHQRRALCESEGSTAWTPNQLDRIEPAEFEDFHALALIFQHDRNTNIYAVGHRPCQGKGASCVR